MLGARRVRQLVRAGAAAAAPALGVHPNRELFERGGDLAARGEAVLVVEARGAAGSGCGCVHEAATAALALRRRLLLLPLRPGGGDADADAARGEGERPLVASRVCGGGAPLQREGRLLLDGGGDGDAGGVADAERADAAGQRVLAVELLLAVGVRLRRGCSRRRRRLRRPLQRLQEVVRPEEETLSGRSRRRLGAGELRQGGLLGGRRVEREEVVRRLISLEPHGGALHRELA